MTTNYLEIREETSSLLHIEVSLILDYPRELIWPIFSDPQKLPLWQPSLRSFEPVSGTPGCVGSVHRLTYRESGYTTTVLETVLAHQAYSLYRCTYATPCVQSTSEHSFTPYGRHHTRWVAAQELEYLGPLRLIAPMSKPFITAKLQQDMRRFQYLLDTQLFTR